MIVAKVGPRSWKSYGSVFTAFVRFCIAEGVDFLPASQSTGLMWAQYLAAKGTVQARTAQPYFSAVNTIHYMLGFDRPCTEQNHWFAAFRDGWQRVQVRLGPGRQLNLAFPAGGVWRVLEWLLALGPADPAFVAGIYVVLNFCTFLRPDSLLSVGWARVVDVAGAWVLQYKPLNWKGRVVSAEAAPVLQLPLCGVPAFRQLLARHLVRSGRLWPQRRDTRGAEEWFKMVLARCGMDEERAIHTLYSLRRGGASAARAVGVPMEVVESFGGWAANSPVLRQHYLDMGVCACPAAHAFFGPLAAGRVAPFVGQYVNR